MRKVTTTNFTAGILSRNFKEIVQHFIASDEAFSFMNTIKGTPASWTKFLHEVLAMVKQLCLPTFFLTLSRADLRWNELISIISKLGGSVLSEDEVQDLFYQDRCKLLNKNPVLVARHFQFRVEMFFKEIILDGLLGKRIYYVIRVGFQVRGNPHTHCFLWIFNAPVLSEKTIESYTEWLVQMISAELPDEDSEPNFFELVKNYQLHRHSKTCQKYRNGNCRFDFGRIFTERTTVAKPLSDSLTELEKAEIMLARSTILNKVKAYIDSELNPVKHNFYDKSRDDFEHVRSVISILNELGISDEDYYNALCISDDNDIQVHLKRLPTSCFVNNYLKTGLLAWEANLNIKPVFNHYKAVTYMCAYLSKTGDEGSHLMNQAFNEAMASKLTNYDRMKSIVLGKVKYWATY